jgi:hypothetical protein
VSSAYLTHVGWAKEEDAATNPSRSLVDGMSSVVRGQLQERIRMQAKT